MNQISKRGSYFPRWARSGEEESTRWTEASLLLGGHRVQGHLVQLAGEDQTVLICFLVGLQPDCPLLASCVTPERAIPANGNLRILSFFPLQLFQDQFIPKNEKAYISCPQNEKNTL